MLRVLSVSQKKTREHTDDTGLACTHVYTAKFSEMIFIQKC